MNLLGNPYVLNVGVVGMALVMGFFVRNYQIMFLGSLFVLMVYCFAFTFEPEGFVYSFLFALYSVFMVFATIGYLVRRFERWILVVN